MKRTFALALLALGAAHALYAAPTYTKLNTPWCDEENKVIYDGKGGFAVQSSADTVVELRINVDSLQSYINSNDYKIGGTMLLWDTDFADYGVADMADMSRPAGKRTPYLCGFWVGRAWQPVQQVDFAALRQWADQDGSVTLRISNSAEKGVTISTADAAGTQHVLYAAPALRASRNKSVQGYRVNLNYVTAVTLHTASSLDTASYTPPADYTASYTRTRTDGTSLGRVMFMGDSITHGVNDQTWRWQLFKTLVDNGIEAEIVGPRSGYTPGYTRLSTPDAGESYGGVPFPNVHLAQSSGRTHNIISGSNAGMSGVNYGGHSTGSSAASYNCDTWVSLMGTNDLLSDAGYTPDDFVAKMQRMLGGKVTYRAGKYSWVPGDDWGNLGRMASDVLREPGDVYYVMAVPCWGRHHNNNQPERHLAVQQYNGLLKQWVEAYGARHQARLIFVDVNDGLVDAAHEVPFSWPDSMSNKPGRDGLHPNAQGSLIMAGNVARAMGIAGRTAGLPRAAADESWGSHKGGSLRAGQSAVCAKEAFTAGGAFSVECFVACGNGAKGGWEPSAKFVSVTIGNGEVGGTLRVSESCILWGDMPLCGGDFAAPFEPLRVVWHPGHQAHNVQRGFYVWLGDKLIGQGLPPAQQGVCNGIRFTASDTDGKISHLRWSGQALAPASSGISHTDRAYHLP